MIPLRDINPTRRTPVVMWCLVAANVAVAMFELYLYFYAGSPVLKAFVSAYGVVPSRLILENDVGTILSSMFLHGGLLHLLGNLWFLWVFGDNVEDAFGHAKFAVFYLVCGCVAAVTQVTMDPSGVLPMVGASGAIAGVLAAYVMMYPRARVVTLVPIFIFIQLVELPAFLFIFVWFGMQLLLGYISLGSVGSAEGGTAFFAHVGGFVAGLVLTPLFRPGRQRASRSSQGRRVVYRPREE